MTRLVIKFCKQHPVLIGAIVLGVLTIALYAPVSGFGFIHLDDYLYVVDNPLVQDGIAAKNIYLSFTTSPVSYWHPVTWLSHMLDCELFGMNAGAHHVVNVLIHAVNSILLFIALHQMTGGFWRSFLVAALFAWHPLHVESVAWISERKDVLYTLFWLLTLWAYAYYADRNRNGFYLLSLLFAIMAMMAKPMAVTLPFVLLLLDVWPLEQLSLSNKVNTPTRQIRKLIIEKLPLFVFAGFICIQTVKAQKLNGAVMSLEQLPVLSRLTNAAIAYVSYLRMMIWPIDLAIIYPHPHQMRSGLAVISGILLLLITLVAIERLRKQPFMTIGWFWYLGTLVPVIGILQVGIQSMADRYTYLPLVGIFMIIAWLLHNIIKIRPMLKPLVVTASCIVLIACFVFTRMQIYRWKDSMTLFTHTLSVTENNWKAHFALGCAFDAQQEPDKAEMHLMKALSLCPDNLNKIKLHCKLGQVFFEQGKIDEAISQFQEALNRDPDYVLTHYRLGLLYESENKPRQALTHYRKALVLNPHSPLLVNRIVWILSTHPEPQIRDGRQAITLAEMFLEDPLSQDADYLCSLAAAYAETGRFDTAVNLAEKALDAAITKGNPELVDKIKACISCYERQLPYREQSEVTPPEGQTYFLVTRSVAR